jgi:hypothetical protein
MGKVTHHRWEECSYDSLLQWVKRRWIEGICSSCGEFLRGRSFFYISQLLESDEQRFRFEEREGISYQLGHRLREAVYKYDIAKTEEEKELCRKNIEDIKRLEISHRQKIIYHRKLRYNSKRRCKYFVGKDFSPQMYISGVYYPRVQECPRAKYPLKKGASITDDIQRRQDWLNYRAISHAWVVYQRHNDDNEYNKSPCGGDWCPGYGP